MAFTKKDLKFIIPFLLFVGIGLWGSFYFTYREDKKALALAAKWFLIPSIIVGGYYAYYGVMERGPTQAKWRKVLALFAVTLIFSLMYIRSFQGFIMIYNSAVGFQKPIIVDGIVTKLDIPKRKKLLNSYTIYVNDSSGQTISLNVPGINYKVGQLFRRQLLRGSLGIIYGN